jgi:hypothetical protein
VVNSPQAVEKEKKQRSTRYEKAFDFYFGFLGGWLHDNA